MGKLLILSMSCNKQCFLGEEKLIKDTWAKDIISGKIENVDWYSYRASTDGKITIDTDNHVLFVPCGDKLFDTYYKTILALRYFCYNFDFDWMLRTNTSTYVNVKSLVQCLDDLDEDDFYGNRVNIDINANDRPYLCGYCALFSRKTCLDIIDSFDGYLTGIDDCKIGLSLSRRLNIGTKLFTKFHTFHEQLFEDANVVVNDKFTKSVAFRIKESKREKMPEKMRFLDEFFKKNKSEYPIIYNTPPFLIYKDFRKYSEIYDLAKTDGVKYKKIKHLRML